MTIQLPTKSFFIPQPPDDREIFWAMQRYPDNVKVYHPHGSIDGTSVFWHNRLWPNILFFAVYVDPKAMNRHFLFHRILDDLTKLAGKFSDKHLVTSDYNPQHDFNQWLHQQGFTLMDKVHCATLNPDGLRITTQNFPTSTQELTVGEALNHPELLSQLLTMSWQAYQDDHPSLSPATVSTHDWQALLLPELVSDIPSLLVNDSGNLITISLLAKSTQTAGKLWLVNESTPGAANRLFANQVTWLKSHQRSLSIYLPQATLKLLGLTEQMAMLKTTTYENFLQ